MRTDTVRPGTTNDWPAIAELLTASKLPLDGAEQHVHDFVLAERDGRLTGCAALERYEGAALLRSVAVAADHRSTGLGATLVRAAIEHARAADLRSLVLLTTTAQDWFPRFGFRVVSRDDVPASVQASAEFRGACPSSAITMRLDLDA